MTADNFLSGRRVLGSIIIFQILTVSLSASGGDKLQNLDINGYISGMPSVNWNKDTALWQGLLHNRININWYPTSSISSSLQLRNQVIAGDLVKQMDIDAGFNKENYAIPLSFKQDFGNMYLLTMTIDRAWIQYTHNNFELKLGRQRINWGQTFAWNPNDIFNTYNFFEFDYPERPGADALRMTYYPNYNSSVEVAAKVDSSGKVTGAGMYRFTKWNTEFQLIGGYYSQSNRIVIYPSIPAIEWDDKDLMGGFGFSGGIKSVSIRGELSYLHSLKEDSDSTNQLMSSLTLDYTFVNDIGVMLEFYYVNKVLMPISIFLSSQSATQNIKMAAFTQYNAFAQLSYPITPIIRATVSGMVFYDEDTFGYFAGPSLDLSLGDNLSMGAIVQVFSFRINKKWENVNYGFLKLKWNF